MEHEQILGILQAELESARRRRYAASERFDDIIRQAPSDIPYPDSVERIRRASREYTQAQTEVMNALNRLNTFLIHGTVPDLKRKPAAKETKDLSNRGKQR